MDNAAIKDHRAAHRNFKPTRGERDRGWAAPKSLAVLFLALIAAAGCSHANRGLNSLGVPLELRKPNQTRAATFAQTLLHRAGSDSGRGRRSELFPATSPSAALARPSVPLDADGCFVGLALSGGGSRSANFSAACMFQLQRLGLLRHVDYISTVSGGSLAGAFYCVSDDQEWNPAAAQHKLTHAFATDVITQSVLPWNLVALATTSYDRSDLLADALQTHLLSRDGHALAYRDLRADRPRLLVNATDLQSGRRFVFCNETFDELNSDLAAYPLAYACAASSAVPVVLHPVTLRDYSTVFEQYRHLIDGGVDDNLGISTLVETYAAQVETARTAGRSDPYPNGAVFVIVDASTRYDAELSAEADTGILEGFKTAAGLSSTALLGRASSATLADLIVHNAPDAATASQMRDEIAQLNTRGWLTMTDRSGHRVRVIYLSLAELNDITDVPFAGFTRALNNIATYFNITDTEAYRLYQAADLLFRAKFDAPIREMMRELGEK